MHLMLCRVGENLVHLLDGDCREHFGDLWRIHAGLPIANNTVFNVDASSTPHRAAALDVWLHFHERAIDPC